MTVPLRSHHWIAWLALVLLACVPLRAAAGDAWLWSLGDPVCEQGASEPCEELGHGDSHHCHCLDTGFPESSRKPHGSISTGTAAEAFSSPADLPSLPLQRFASATPTRVEGPPVGSPFVSGVGLTLHD